MKKWKVFGAQGTLLMLTNSLNEIERQGYAVHQVLPEREIPSPDGRVHMMIPFWAIVAYKSEAQP